MARIGFIGASGMMGHGMARNLLAKGHALALTVHRNRERVADLLAAGATEAGSAAALARITGPITAGFAFEWIAPNAGILLGGLLAFVNVFLTLGLQRRLRTR